MPSVERGVSTGRDRAADFVATADLVAAADPGSGVVSGADLVAGAVSDADTVSGVDPDAGAAPGVDTGADVVSGVDTGAGVVSGVDPGEDVVSGVDPGADVVSGVDPGAGRFVIASLPPFSIARIAWRTRSAVHRRRAFISRHPRRIASSGCGRNSGNRGA